jgi:hypothetical protein
MNFSSFLNPKYLQYNLFSASIFLLYISYFLLFFGVYKFNEKYVHYLSVFVHIFVCVFLLIRFNPFSRVEINSRDKNVIFSAAILLLFNVVFAEVGISSSINSMITPATTQPSLSSPPK